VGKTDSASQSIISFKEDGMEVMKWPEEKGKYSGMIEIYLDTKIN